jgi:hypothetical protein
LNIDGSNYAIDALHSVIDDFYLAELANKDKKPDDNSGNTTGDDVADDD